MLQIHLKLRPPLRLILPRFWLVLKQLPVIFDRLGQTCSVLAQPGLYDWVGKHWNQRAHPCHVFDHPPCGKILTLRLQAWVRALQGWGRTHE